VIVYGWRSIILVMNGPMLDRIRIVLINTSHPGNIGAAARAMKTMGLAELYLVDPIKFPHAEAEAMATGAVNILDDAVVVKTLEEAVTGCTLVVGTSARNRTIPWPLLPPRQVAEKVRHEPAGGRTAIVFGREQSGLTNDELARCHLHVQIPANPDYSSLNIAAAVQVIAYELRVASLDEAPVTETEEWDYRLATADEMERLFEHLEQVLQRIDFLKANAPRRLMTRLRRFFFRARPDVMEMNIFRGMLGAIEDATPKKEI
jgi:tRNA (cytidine32/uridine32-2'-O)-methyltransferase